MAWHNLWGTFWSHESNNNLVELCPLANGTPTHLAVITIIWCSIHPGFDEFCEVVLSFSFKRCLIQSPAGIVSIYQDPKALNSKNHYFTVNILRSRSKSKRKLVKQFNFNELKLKLKLILHFYPKQRAFGPSVVSLPHFA